MVIQSGDAAVLGLTAIALELVADEDIEHQVDERRQEERAVSPPRHVQIPEDRADDGGLMVAVQRQRPGPGLVHHSDRGSQYAAEAYRKQLAAMKAKPSMSRTGCCYDNAPMESFFHTLKVELVHQRRWATRDEARRDLFAYIEGYYNRQRIHSALGYLTPEQAERNAS